MFLDEVAEEKRAEVESALRSRSVEELTELAARRTGRRSLAEAVAAPGMSVIAEVKRRSPSGGKMKCTFTPAELAAVYQEAGAAAVSVLTDGPHFGGSLVDLSEVRGATLLPVMRKDFIVDEYQLYEAAAFGADATLLIARLLEGSELSRLTATAEEIGLEVLVEVHDERDVTRAVDAGATLIGINSRDLSTFEVETSVFFKLRPLIPSDRLVVAESGISEPEQLRALQEAGVDGALIGTALMSCDEPQNRLRELIGAKE